MFTVSHAFTTGSISKRGEDDIWSSGFTSCFISPLMLNIWYSVVSITVIMHHVLPYSTCPLKFLSLASMWEYIVWGQ